MQNDQGMEKYSPILGMESKSRLLSELDVAASSSPGAVLDHGLQQSKAEPSRTLAKNVERRTDQTHFPNIHDVSARLEEITRLLPWQMRFECLPRVWTPKMRLGPYRTGRIGTA